MRMKRVGNSLPLKCQLLFLLSNFYFAVAKWILGNNAAAPKSDFAVQPCSSTAMNKNLPKITIILTSKTKEDFSGIVP